MFISKQPVLNRDDQIEAFIFYYTPYEEDANDNHTEGFIDSLYQIGLKNLTDGKPGILKLNQKMLMDSSVHTYPSELIVLGLDDRQAFGTEIIQRINELKSNHFRFALFHTNEENNDLDKLTSILPFLDYFIIDAEKVERKAIEPMLKTLKQHPVTLLASNVHEQQLKTDFQAMGFEHIGGAFFTQNQTEEREEIEADYLKVLELLNILEQSDSIDEIASSFATHPEITLQLLQFLNSPAFGLTRSVKSIRHALLLIGRKDLRQWLLIMAFSRSASDNESESPLLYTAQVRVALMQYLVENLKDLPESVKNEASFVAVLSLLQPLIGISHQKLFETIAVDASIEQAVTKYEGILGTLLELCIASEHYNKALAYILLQKIGMDPSLFEKATLNGYKR